MIKNITFFCLVFITLWGCKAAPGTAILYPENCSDLEILAAREVRRYIYLRTGELLPVREAGTIPSGNVILVAENKDPMMRSGSPFFQ